jgi:lipoprotein signal peptidase
VLGAAFLTVIATDQAAKWWAWRHVDGVFVNTGGYILLGRARWWFADPVIGAVADVVGSALVAVSVCWLLRPRSWPARLGGALAAAGWASNILDRLGVHRWTAPGSARGVVDFIPGGGPGRHNVADLWIVLGLLLLAWALIRRLRSRVPIAARPPSLREAVAVLAVAAVATAFAVSSAIDHTGRYAPAG